MIAKAPNKGRATRQQRAIARLLSAVDRSIRAADEAREARDELLAAARKKDVARA